MGGTNGGGGATAGPSNQGAAKPRKLSYREREEWKALPGRIEELETEQGEVDARLADPDFYKGSPEEIRAVTQRAKEIAEEIENAFERWGALDERA